MRRFILSSFAFSFNYSMFLFILHIILKVEWLKQCAIIIGYHSLPFNIHHVFLFPFDILLSCFSLLDCSSLALNLSAHSHSLQFLSLRVLIKREVTIVNCSFQLPFHHIALSLLVFHLSHVLSFFDFAALLIYLCTHSCSQLSSILNILKNVKLPLATIDYHLTSTLFSYFHFFFLSNFSSFSLLVPLLQSDH
jgi:hypothetical protein